MAFRQIRACTQWKGGLQNELERLRCSLIHWAPDDLTMVFHRAMQRIAYAQFPCENNLRPGFSFNPLHYGFAVADGMGPSPEERASCSDCLSVIF